MVETVRSIVDPITKDTGGGYAIVDGPHQVFDLAGDGGIKRVSLADLLAVGSPQSHWRFPYDEHLDMEALREVYRGAAALVDISQAGKSGAAILASFNAHVRRNPSMVLVAPHTHALQEFFGQVAVAGQGEEAQTTYRDANRDERPRWGGEADPLDYTSSVPVHAEFKITGLIQDGAWQDPSDLEAARALLQARYDLTLGIGTWRRIRRLMHNPPRPLLSGPRPGRGSGSGGGQCTGEVETRDRGGRLGGVAAALQPIIDVGWMRRRGGGVSFAYILAEGEALVQNPSPALSLWLALSKTQSTVRLQSRIQEVYMHEGLQQYLVARRELFEGIAAPFSCDLEATTPAIWLEPGGTATEEVDWSARGRAIAESTSQWVAAFSDLVAECHRIEAIPTMERMMAQGRIRFNPSQR